MMDFETFRTANRARCETSAGFGHALGSWRPSQWSNAMAGECGEACNITKKIDRVLDHLPGNYDDATLEMFAEMLKREIGDMVIYADLLAQHMNFRLEDCVRTAFNEKSEEIGSGIRLV